MGGIIINNINDLSDFCDAYNALSGSHITAVALATSTVYGLYKSNPVEGSPPLLIGGFAVGTKGPFRSLKVLVSPLDFTQRQLADAEICCLWLAPSERSMRNRIQIVWLMYQALRSGQHSQILAITTKKRLWENVYRPSGAKFLTLADAEFRKGVIQPAWLFTMTKERVLVLGLLGVLLRPVSKYAKSIKQ